MMRAGRDAFARPFPYNPDQEDPYPMFSCNRIIPTPRRHAGRSVISRPALLVIAALAAPVAAARAQEPAPDSPAPPETSAPPAEVRRADDEDAPRRRSRRRFRIGPEAGVFLPSAGKTRDRFGDAWTSIGIGLGGIPRADEEPRLGIDLRVIATRRGDNRALFVPIGLAYRQPFATGRQTIPYAGGSVNVFLARLRSPADGVDSGTRTGTGGSVFVGTTLGETSYLEARYLFASKIRGFDLSGLYVTAGFRL